MASGKIIYKPTTVKGSGGQFIQMFLDDSNKHFIDAIRETTYNEMLLNGGRRHSEFMQPYLNPDYPSMDYLWPDTGFFGDVPGANDALIQKTGGGGAGGAYKFQCIISCEATISGSKCDTSDPIKCYYGAITGDGIISHWSIGDAPIDFAGVNFEEGSGTVAVEGTPVRPWKSLSSSTGYWMKVQYTDVGDVGGWYYHPLLDKWIYIEGGFSTCYYNVYINCILCPPDVEISFDDDNTSDTISKNSGITTYVLNGQPPYTWVTGSTGYSFSLAETDVPYNTLSCVDGSCGVEFDPYASCIVTDACGDSVSFNIRNDDGQWTGIGNFNAQFTGGSCTPMAVYCMDDNIDVYGSNIYKWAIAQGRWYRGSCSDMCAANTWTYGGGVVPPPCGGPHACACAYENGGGCTGTIGETCYLCVCPSGAYSEWTC